MDAPTYPPATEYRQPAVVPQPVNTRTTSIADLMAIPAARTILTEEVPGFDRMASAGPLRPHLGNMSLRSLVVFGAFQTAQLDRVDVRLRAANIVMGTLR